MPEQAEETEQKYILCPCCRKSQIPKPVEIDSPIMDHYMSCIMTGVPFSHTYELYGGKLAITATMLAHEESLDLSIATSTLELCKAKMGGEMDETLSELIGMLNVYAQIDTISSHDKTKLNMKSLYNPKKVVFDICKDLNEKRYKIIQNDMTTDDIKKMIENAFALCKNTSTMSALPAAILSTVQRTHDTLYSILVEAGFDPNFWKGIELG